MKITETLLAQPGTALMRTTDSGYWSRCTRAFEHWSVCALSPVTELHALRNELVRVGESEGRALTVWLIIIGAGICRARACLRAVAARRAGDCVPDAVTVRTLFPSLSPVGQVNCSPTQR